MKGTGAKRNVCPGSCVSTGAKFPVAPVESAPMESITHYRGSIFTDNFSEDGNKIRSLQEKNHKPPPNGCQIMCSKSFFLPGNELRIYHGNFLLMDNKHRKLLVIEQSKGCKCMPKVRQHTSGGRAPPGPALGAYALPQTL